MPFSIWSNVTFNLLLNVTVPLYVSAEMIPITTEIATRTPNDIKRYLSDEGRFYAQPEERRLELSKFQSEGHTLVSGSV